MQEHQDTGITIGSNTVCRQLLPLTPFLWRLKDMATGKQEGTVHQLLGVG